MDPVIAGAVLLLVTDALVWVWLISMVVDIVKEARANRKGHHVYS